MKFDKTYIYILAAPGVFASAFGSGGGGGGDGTNIFKVPQPVVPSAGHQGEHKLFDLSCLVFFLLGLLLSVISGVT